MENLRSILVFNFNTTRIGGLSLIEARTVMITCLVLLFQLAGWLFLELQNNQGSTVVCIRVEVRIVYDAKTLDAQQP
jgi:hypothetical protein